MEEISEFAGNLKAALLCVREDLRTSAITEEQALQRIKVIRRRARSGDDGLRRIGYAVGASRATKGGHESLSLFCG